MACRISAPTGISPVTCSCSVWAGTVPAPLKPDAATVAIMALAVASFAAITLLQLAGPSTRSAAWARAYVHLANGLYANPVFNRLAGALRRPDLATATREIA